MKQASGWRLAFVSTLSGVVFAAGLCLSGMVRPSKILAFLKISAAWDPSLLLVMGAAVATYALLFRFYRGPVPSTTRIDKRLVIGAALFGLGWGLSGYCPGPSLIATLAAPSTLVFVGSMLIGMLLAIQGLGKRPAAINKSNR